MYYTLFFHFGSLCLSGRPSAAIGARRLPPRNLPSHETRVLFSQQNTNQPASLSCIHQYPTRHEGKNMHDSKREISCLFFGYASHIFNVHNQIKEYQIFRCL